MIEQKNIKTKKTLFFLLLILGGLFGFLILSFVHALLFGVIFGGILLPLQEKLKKKLKIPNFTIAFLITLAFAAVLVIPLILIVYSLAFELIDLYQKFSMFNTVGNWLNFNSIPVGIKKIFQSYNITLNEETVNANLKEWFSVLLNFTLSQAQSLTQSSLNFLFQSVLMLLILLGILSHGQKLKGYAFNILPQNQKKDFEILIARFHQINFVTVVINCLSGVLQGLAWGLFLFFLGFANALVLGVLMVFAAFVPVFGVMLVCTPISVYLYYHGETSSAVAFFSLTLAGYFFIENYVKPKYIGKKLDLHPLLLFLAILAGVAQFGIFGLFYGPLLLSLFLTTLDLMFLPKEG